MVAEAAEVSWSDVSTEELLAMIGLVVFQHEVGMKDAGATFFIMKAFPIIYHRWRDDDLVENLPIRLMLQSAFEAQTYVFPKQIDEATFLQLTGMSRPQHVVDTWVSRTIV